MIGCGQTLRNAGGSAKCPRPPIADGKMPYERRFGEQFKVVNNTFLEQWFNVIRLHRKIRREFIKLARKY